MGVLTRKLACLLFALTVLLTVRSVSAQGRVMVLQDPRVDDEVRSEVSEALSSFSQVRVDRFVQAADAKHLDPLSDAAFSRAFPPGVVDVAVVLLPARRGLTMMLRSGRDGTVLSRHVLKLRRGKLGRKARKSIPKLVQRVMAKLPPESDRASEHEPVTMAEQQPAQREHEDVVDDDPAASDESALDDQSRDGDESAEATATSEPADDAEPRVIRLHVDLGTGLSTRSLEFPIEAGQGSLSLGPSAALDVGLEAAYDPPTAVSWAFQLRYQTTVGARLDEHQIGGVERPMGIRSARFEALFVPGVDLSESVQLRFALGYGLRGLRTDVHDQELSTVHSLRTPDFTLSGPVAGIALQLMLSDSIALTLAPQAQLLVTVGSDLKQRGVAGGGFAFGGTASLVVTLSRALSLYVAYRQAHAQIAGESGRADVRDGERYMTAGLRGAL